MKSYNICVSHFEISKVCKEWHFMPCCPCTVKAGVYFRMAVSRYPLAVSPPSPSGWRVVVTTLIGTGRMVITASSWMCSSHSDLQKVKEKI